MTISRLLIWMSAFLIIGSMVLNQLSSTTAQVWDDACMFVRYADNFNTYGKLIWNSGDSPTWGPTSLLYTLGVVAPARLIFKHSAILAAFVSSLTCGMAFLIVLALLIERSLRSNPMAAFAGALLTFAAVYLSYCPRSSFAEMMRKTDQCESHCIATIVTAYGCRIEA